MIDNELIIIQGAKEIPVYTGHIPGISPEDRVTPPGYISIFETGEATVYERPSRFQTTTSEGNIADVRNELAQIATRSADSARSDA